jgi:hypothetical protein
VITVGISRLIERYLRSNRRNSKDQEEIFSMVKKIDYLAERNEIRKRIRSYIAGMILFVALQFAFLLVHNYGTTMLLAVTGLCIAGFVIIIGFLIKILQHKKQISELEFEEAQQFLKKKELKKHAKKKSKVKN